MRGNNPPVYVGQKVLVRHKTRVYNDAQFRPPCPARRTVKGDS
jgi:hypothetical protein